MGLALSDMQLTSAALESGSEIGRQYTGEGDDIAPPLAWDKVPEGTKAFALFCHDPDAPRIAADGSYGFVHWVLYNIPGSVRRLDEDCRDYTSGNNDFGRSGYGGPMPPPGHGTHYYFFCLLALNDDSALPEGLCLQALLKAIEPRVIGMNRLVGTYQRSAA